MMTIDKTVNGYGALLVLFGIVIILTPGSYSPFVKWKEDLR